MRPPHPPESRTRDRRATAPGFALTALLFAALLATLFAPAVAAALAAALVVALAGVALVRSLPVRSGSAHASRTVRSPHDDA
jgi:hypothetical protein